jgi:hypothetical protein
VFQAKVSGLELRVHNSGIKVRSEKLIVQS